MLDQLAEDDAAAAAVPGSRRASCGAAAVRRDQPDNLTSRLAKLTAADNPWRYSALELSALAQLRAGDTAAARETLASLVDDPRTPPDLGRRAAELLSALGGPSDADVAGGRGRARTPRRRRKRRRAPQ